MPSETPTSSWDPGHRPTNPTGPQPTAPSGTSGPRTHSTVGRISSANRSKISPSSSPVSRGSARTPTTTPTLPLFRTKLLPGLTALNGPSSTSTPHLRRNAPWWQSQPSPANADCRKQQNNCYLTGGTKPEHLNDQGNSRVALRALPLAAPEDEWYITTPEGTIDDPNDTGYHSQRRWPNPTPSR